MTKRHFVPMVMFCLAATFARGQEAVVSQKSARETLMEFCNMDAEGRQLTAEGWQQLAAMFVQPSASRPDRAIIVSRDFVISDEKLAQNRADLYVEYQELGQIDSSAHFGPPPGPHHMRVLYSLVRVESHGVEGQGNATSTDDKHRLEWKIADTQREPRITREAAVRYVTKLRDNTNDSTVKKNADRTLVLLSGIH